MKKYFSFIIHYKKVWVLSKTTRVTLTSGSLGKQMVLFDHNYRPHVYQKVIKHKAN
jgi:hypothetical protein